MIDYKKIFKDRELRLKLIGGFIYRQDLYNDVFE